MRRSGPVVSAWAALFLTGCSLAPDYQRPSAAAPASFKEAGDWVPARPLDGISRGAWWSLFDDPLLTQLEEKVTAANQTLKAAAARYDQARALVSIAQAALAPTVGVNASADRDQRSTTVAPAAAPRDYANYALTASLSYEIDLWGRVHNAILNQDYQAQASAAQLASVALSLQSELAVDYFTLRGLDAQQALLDQTVANYKAAYDLTVRRYQGGAAAEVDVDQAETQWNAAKTQASDTRLNRAQREHAIAILIGSAPADFSVAPAPLAAAPRVVQTGLPSTLLERRPDVASAERLVAAANANIGVAEAAFFPVFSIGGDGGFATAAPGKLFSLPSLLWGIGPQAALTVFDFGRRNAVTAQARAAYDETVANYRSTVLNAYGEVEDNLAALRHLEDESHSQEFAVRAAERSLGQAQRRYTGGLVTYLEVVTAQSTALSTEQAAIDILVRRMVASVQLVRALGGGWTVSSDLASDAATAATATP